MSQRDNIGERELAILACPRDRTDLSFRDGAFHCRQGHSYPEVEGIPVFLLDEKEQTIGIASASLKCAQNRSGGPLYLDTLGLSPDEKRGIERAWTSGKGKIDPAISYLIGATSGFGYIDLIGRVTEYPIPNIPIESGNGRTLLDVGANWGRWSVSAARKGWRVIALDPSLGALRAASRAFSSQGLDISFICGDARYLPFKPAAVDAAFSYSVLQHFSEQEAELALQEIGRVLMPNGFAKIQMAHSGGLRSTYVRTRPNYRNAGIFRVRYWPLKELRAVFEKQIGHTRLIAEAYGGLGLLAEDTKFVSKKARLLIKVSGILKTLARVFRPLIGLADSVYVVAIKR